MDHLYSPLEQQSPHIAIGLIQHGSSTADAYRHGAYQRYNIRRSGQLHRRHFVIGQIPPGIDLRTFLAYILYAYQ